MPVREAGYGRYAVFLAYGEREAVLNTDDPRYAKALRHPLRVRILATLQESEATPTQLAERLGASVGTVAYHVRTLASLGLIRLVGETRVRGAVAHHYRAVARPERGSERPGQAVSANESPPGATLCQLDPGVCPIAAMGRFEDDGALATHASLRLDTVGWQQLSRACTELLEEADRLARSSAERMAQNPDEGGRDVGMVLFVFEAGSEKRKAIS